jgi:hypothetical protein
MAQVRRSARRLRHTISEKRAVYELTLSEGEADFLIALLSLVSGGHHSPARYGSRMLDSLRGASGLHPHRTDAWRLLGKRVEVRFRDYPTRSWAEARARKAERAGRRRSAIVDELPSARAELQASSSVGEFPENPESGGRHERRTRGDVLQGLASRLRDRLANGTSVEARGAAWDLASAILGRDLTAHTGMKAHDGYAEHTHEVRPDHKGVARIASRDVQPRYEDEPHGEG